MNSEMKRDAMGENLSCAAAAEPKCDGRLGPVLCEMSIPEATLYGDSTDIVNDELGRQSIVPVTASPLRI